MVALWLAPWLGSVHAVLHARLPASVVATATAGGDGIVATAIATAVAPVASVASAARPLRRLFGDHGHEGDCRIYDQLSHADGLHLTQALPPVLLPPLATMAWHAGECLRRWATLFDARGPPVLV
ncbi:hypothetical protein GN316_07180 [Xylophilus sp. Kf1]|nr:hypothetical protein [Xylophilus sp. Kf1]